MAQTALNNLRAKIVPLGPNVNSNYGGGNNNGLGFGREQSKGGGYRHSQISDRMNNIGSGYIDNKTDFDNNWRGKRLETTDNPAQKTGFGFAPDNTESWPEIGFKTFVEFVVSFFFYWIVSVSGTIGIDVLTYSLIQGLTLYVVVATCWHFSAGHVNPAVTFSMWLVGFTNITTAILYIVAQFAGSALAVALVIPFADVSTRYGAPKSMPTISTLEAWGWEFIGSAILYSVILWIPIADKIYKEIRTAEANSAASLDNFTSKLQNLYGEKANYASVLHFNPSLVIGMTLFVLVVPGSFYSGGAYNFLRWLWPAIFSGSATSLDFAVYFFGPFAGLLPAVGLGWATIKWIRNNYKYIEMENATESSAA